MTTSIKWAGGASALLMLVALPGGPADPAAAAAPGSWPWGVEATIGSGWPDPARVRFADLNGDGRDELVNIQPNGVPHAWTNNGRFPRWPWGREADIGAGWSDPASMHFADVNGDGYDDVVRILPNGGMHAWTNNRNFPGWPWGAEADFGSVLPQPGRSHFTDLTADRPDDLVEIQLSGALHAWRNTGNFPSWTWNTEADIGWGWHEPARVRFADLNGDGLDELVHIQSNGVAHARTNNGDYPAWPWGLEADIGSGWTSPARMLFTDLNGDNYEELVQVGSNGILHAWTNNRAFS